MTPLSNPTDIARETLKQLASRRIAPTPDNYRELYVSIAGGGSAVDEQPLDRKLAALASALPESQGKQRELVQRALAKRDWQSARGAIIALADAHAPREGAPAEDWSEVTGELLEALEARHGGLTRAKKRESLDKLLETAGRDKMPLASRVRNLVKSWNEAPVERGIEAANEPATGGEDLATPLRDCLAVALEMVLPGLLRHAPDLAWESRMLATRARQATQVSMLEQVANDLRQFTRRVELHAGGDGEVREGLLRILRLLIDNIQDLVDNDHWIQGQVALICNALDRPITPEVIEQTERTLKELIAKQGTLKRSLDEAKESLKAMLQDFIVRLGELSGDTGEYHGKLQAHADRIQRSGDAATLMGVIHELLSDTRAMQTSADQCRVALTSARDHVQAAELRIREMETELEQLSERVREDQLTGTLNRRGLEDAFKRESGRADRQDSPMCIALLDVDNFKQLNDRLGHQAGDQALLHLVKVIRGHLRPADALARYGGEEFVILLPDSDMSEAIEVMTRLQRELTKEFFLHNNERLLITFSCGVADRLSGEELEPAMGRADKALYHAKRAGKNRVMTAPSPAAGPGVAQQAS